MPDPEILKALDEYNIYVRAMEQLKRDVENGKYTLDEFINRRDGIEIEYICNERSKWFTEHAEKFGYIYREESLDE